MAFGPKKRKRLIDHLVTNCSCGENKVWDEEDREMLNNMNDEQLLKLGEYDQHAKAAEFIANAALQVGTVNQQGLFVVNAKKKKGDDQDNKQDDEEDEDEEEEEEEGDDEDDAKKKVDNAAIEELEEPITNLGGSSVAKKKMSDEEWLKTAPPGIREVVTNALNREAQDKSELIMVITANERNQFPEEYLVTRSVDELKAIAALAAPIANTKRVPNFSGAGAPTGNAAGNVNSMDDGDLLEMPTINYGEMASERIKTRLGRN